MTMENKVLKELEEIGLKKYEARAYLALLQLGEAVASAIANKAGIPQPRIYDVLESLLDKGLIEIKMGRPKKYKIVRPRIAFPLFAEKSAKNIMRIGEELARELDKMYTVSEIVESEPKVWILYNPQVGLEKLREALLLMEYDAIMSFPTEIYNEVLPTILNIAKNKVNSVFAITIYGRQEDLTSLDKISQVPNIEVRILPTGSIKLVEVDYKWALVFGKNYLIHFGEIELLRIIDEVYYFSTWRAAEKIKEINVNSGQHFRLRHHWLAMDIIEEALSKGFKVKAVIYGYKVKDKSQIKVEGYAECVRKDPKDSVRTIVLKDNKGRVVTVGARDAVYEDVEAETIEIKIQ